MAENIKLTYQEAVETLESNRPTSGYAMLNVAIDMSKAALSKQIPQKPIKGKTGNLAFKCGLVLQNGNNRHDLYFCHNCGQRIDLN